MNILIFLIILLVLVIVHEFGHFFSAKKFGIRVDEFGFGFPPKLFGKKYKETEYSFNALPFGGFVKIFGESPDEESLSGPDSARSFVNKPKWQQAIVLFAGVFANFLLAWFLFTVGFASGMPASVGAGIAREKLQDVNLVVLAVEEDSPAEHAGLLPGDKIISVQSEGENLPEINSDTFKNFIVGHSGDMVDLEYRRGEGTEMTTVVPEIYSGEEAKIGIAMDEIGTAKLGIFEAFVSGGALTLDITKGTVLGLYSLIVAGLQGLGSWGNVTGPVGLIGLVGDVASYGFIYLLSFTALISINLAVINLIPFPALDGGRLLFLLIEKIKGSRLNPKFANAANFVGFAILILLMLVVTYHDVVKLF